MCLRCSMRVAPGEITCPNCGLILPPEHGHPPLVQVGGLGMAVAILLSVSGACVLYISVTDAADNSGLLEPVSFAVFIALVPTFITWLFLVGRNAGRWGPQRRHRDWAIFGWFLPVVMVWFPYQIADDAWQASRPPGGGGVLRSRAIVIGWWLCWVVAWTDGLYHHRQPVGFGSGCTTAATSFTFALGSTVVSGVFAAAAAVLGVAMVLTLSRWQRQRIDAARLIPQD